MTPPAAPEFSVGFDQGTPGGDVSALTIVKNGHVTIFDGYDAEIIQQAIESARRQGKREATELIGYALLIHKGNNKKSVEHAQKALIETFAQLDVEESISIGKIPIKVNPYLSSNEAYLTNGKQIVKLNLDAEEGKV